jgi:hypothetical protein
LIPAFAPFLNEVFRAGLLLAYFPLQLLKWASHLALDCWFEKSWPHLGHTVVSLNMPISWSEYPKSFNSTKVTCFTVSCVFINFLSLSILIIVYEDLLHKGC